MVAVSSVLTVLLGLPLGMLLHATSPGGLTPQRVRDKVAQAWGTTSEALQSKKRTKDLTIPRQVAMYLIKEMFDLALVEIGKLFGGRDHSTVIHSVSKVEEDLVADPELRRKVDELRASLR